jgi:succinate-semialdehyde dehydrogenase/glutarate-semialdehyde dehydrogenase
VVSVHRVSSDAEAVACANDTRYGLSATIWTRDLRRGRWLAGQIRAGSVSVNESYLVSWGSVAAPIGGWGESGLGRRHGVEGLLRYTQSQTVAAQRRPGLGVLFAGEPGRLPVLFTAALRAARAAHLPWP